MQVAVRDSGGAASPAARSVPTTRQPGDVGARLMSVQVQAVPQVEIPADWAAMPAHLSSIRWIEVTRPAAVTH
jgi:hypothetical protein